MHIQFMGAARTVTGSRHLLTVNGKNILLDCGMYQDKPSIKGNKNEHFGFDPRSIDAVILSHAHIDHSGSLPRLVKDGYRGPIYATPATIDLCKVMLADSARIQESDSYYKNKRRKLQGKQIFPPVYNEQDVVNTIPLFEPVDYNQLFVIDNGIRFRFTDAGHIMGSAAVHLELQENGKETHLTFTGDIGRMHDLILRDPAPFPQADYIICESTYGDRLHDPYHACSLKLLHIIQKTCIEKKGKLLIPAFSLGRTQEIVYTMDRMKSAGLLPDIPVFVDSPLSVNATDIMRKHTDNFNEDILKYMQSDPNPFGFDGLHYIQNVEDSKALNYFTDPCIIISASGMLEAGRIKHHLRNNIENPDNTLLMVGYSAPGTLGAELLNGAKKVRIFGEYFSVNMEVQSLQEYSAHADYKEIIHFLSCQDKEKVKRVILVHGEYNVQQKFAETLKKEGFRDIYIPEYEEVVMLE
ncbi:MAG: MBL fold metallo-hydrolase [Bacteroidia bacterium]